MVFPLIFENMEYNGIVTAVDQVFCYFELNNCIKVHMSILLSQKGLNLLPKVNSNVIIKHAHKKESMFVLCLSSSLIADCSLPVTSDEFINIVRKYNLGVADLVVLDKLIGLIEKNFSNICYDLKVQLVQSTFEFLSNKSSIKLNSKRHPCLNHRIACYKFITTSSCRYVEINSQKYKDFPHWSFGVHSNPNEYTVLLGYLEIHPNYGFLTLKDSNYHMAVVVYDSSQRDIESVINSYVLIKNYRVITEIYKENVPNVEYMLVNYDDIITLQYSQSSSNQCLTISETKLFENCMYFQIIQKSLTCIGSTKKPECWLQILIKRENNESEQAFLILPKDYIKAVIHLKQHHNYKLSYNLCLVQTTYWELTRIARCSIFLLTDTEAVFEKLGSSNGKINYFTVTECKEYVTNNTDMISFQGVLKSKRFANNLPSRTAKHSSIYGFGTPGSKVHQLVFSGIGNNGPMYLDVYLNNWENILMPLGLIPQMNVIVRNVYPQSKKYLKSSPFTSFEVVSYEPTIDFHTVNLYQYDNFDWGPHFFLSHGHKLPSNVIIWGKILDMKVLKLKWTNACKNCLELPVECIKCQGGEKEMDFHLLMHVSDEFGQSKVIVKDVNFIKILLDIQERPFQVWKKAFETVREFTFNVFEDQDHNNASESGFFKNVLCDYINRINSNSLIQLDLKCRKLDSNLNENGGRSFWFCLDSRRSFSQ